ncbi:MAG: MFS transporter [Candidatus Kariarchaeaceae archaeon]|jgi:MFS family permease
MDIVDPKESSSAKKKSSNLLFYSIQSFLSFGQNLAFQFLPIYTRKLGASESQMGLLTAVQNVFSTLFSPFWGKRSDNIGRKVFLILGGFIAFASSIIIAIAENPVQIIVGVGINSFGLSMLLPAWQGAIADYTEGRTRGGFMGRLVGISYGYVTVALTLYAFLSPSIDVAEIDQYRIIMWLSVMNFALVVFVSWFLIDLRNPNRSKNSDGLFTPLEDPKFRRFLLVILIWWFFMSLAWSYFPTVIADVIDASTSQIAWLGIYAAIVQSLASYYLGGYIDKVGSKKSLILGFLPFSVVPFFFAFATEWWHLIGAQLIAGIGIGFGFTALQTYILNISGEERAGSYMGTYYIFWGLLTFVGSLFGGVFLDWYADYIGDLGKALTILLIFIGSFRILSNVMMIKLLPTPPVLD